MGRSSMLDSDPLVDEGRGVEVAGVAVMVSVDIFADGDTATAQDYSVGERCNGAPCKVK